METQPRSGLRERKKQATHRAIREAALRLALEHGPENVRVDAIAEAANVSPRTYNNYFSSREQAIVAAVTAERDARVAAAVAARPDAGLADALIDAIVEEYTDAANHDPRVLLLLTSHSALREAYFSAATEIEDQLTTVIAQRIGDPGGQAAQVLSASVAAAIRVGLRRWLMPSDTASRTGLLIASTGSLSQLLQAALAPLAPALDAADRRPA